MTMDLLKEVKYIAVHCAYTPAGRDDTAADIKRWHLAAGYDDIAYHYVIRINGTIESGRELKYAGAHEPAINRNSIAICLIGGMDADKTGSEYNYTEAQMSALRGLVTNLIVEYSIDNHIPIVVGHNEFRDDKTCPNFNVPLWWAFGDIQEIL